MIVGNVKDGITDICGVLRAISETKGDLGLTIRDGNYIVEKIPGGDYAPLYEHDTDVLDNVMEQVFQNEDSSDIVDGLRVTDHIQECCRSVMGEVKRDFNSNSDLQEGFRYWLEDVSKNLSPIYLRSNYAKKTIQLWV